MPPREIKMVFFDYGRVLFDHDGDVLAEGLAEISHPALSPAEAIRKLYGAGIVKRYDNGVIDTKEFLDEMEELLGFHNRREFIRLWCLVHHPNLRIWKALVNPLLQCGYGVGVISNTNELHALHIEDLFIPDQIALLSPLVYSYREHVGKPEPEIWRRAVGQANKAYCRPSPLLPEECLLVDDMYENVASFEAFGGNAIQHDPRFVYRTAAKLMDLGVRL